MTNIQKQRVSRILLKDLHHAISKLDTQYNKAVRIMERAERKHAKAVCRLADFEGKGATIAMRRLAA